MRRGLIARDPPDKRLLTGHENHDRVLFVGVHCCRRSRFGECPGNSTPATAAATQGVREGQRDPAGAANLDGAILEKTRYRHRQGTHRTPGQDPSNRIDMSAKPVNFYPVSKALSAADVKKNQLSANRVTTRVAKQNEKK